MNWFHALFLDPGTSYWRYLLRVSVATFVVQFAYSFALAILLPRAYWVDPDNIEKLIDPSLGYLIEGVLLWPAVFGLVAAFGTRALRTRVKNKYIISGAVTLTFSAISISFGSHALTAIYGFWLWFAASLACQVSYSASFYHAVGAGFAVTAFYNAAALSMWNLY